MIVPSIPTLVTSSKDSALMAVLGVANTETLLYDFSETEIFYLLVVPPELSVKTLFSVTIASARKWFGLNGANNLQIFYNPFLTWNLTFQNPLPPPPLTDASSTEVTVDSTIITVDMTTVIKLMDETTGRILTSDDGSFVLTVE